MLSRRHLLSPANLTTAGLVLAARGGEESQSPKEKVLTATIGYTEPHTIFAPGGGGGGPSFSGSQVLERLGRYNADQTFSPVLAESWTVAPDSRSVSVKLRQGVTWHDGKPFTAEDVAWTVRNYWKPSELAMDVGRASG
jgi:peptide/nickel transport system substrate-binding protein